MPSSPHHYHQWHLGHCNLSLTPMRRGFDSFLGFWGGSEDHFTHFAGDMYDFRDGEEVCRLGPLISLATRLAPDAVACCGACLLRRVVPRLKMTRAC